MLEWWAGGSDANLAFMLKASLFRALLSVSPEDDLVEVIKRKMAGRKDKYPEGIAQLVCAVTSGSVESSLLLGVDTEELHDFKGRRFCCIGTGVKLLTR
jgi:hypothetical protein